MKGFSSDLYLLKENELYTVDRSLKGCNGNIHKALSGLGELFTVLEECLRNDLGFVVIVFMLTKLNMSK